MGIPPFNSSRRAGSNGGIFVLLRPLDLNGIWDGIGMGFGFGMEFGMEFGIGMGLWQMGWDDGIWDRIWDGMGVGILPFPLRWVASICAPCPPATNIYTMREPYTCMIIL